MQVCESVIPVYISPLSISTGSSLTQLALRRDLAKGKTLFFTVVVGD